MSQAALLAIFFPLPYSAKRQCELTKFKWIFAYVVLPESHKIIAKSLKQQKEILKQSFGCQIHCRFLNYCLDSEASWLIDKRGRGLKIKSSCKEKQGKKGYPKL